MSSAWVKCAACVFWDAGDDEPRDLGICRALAPIARVELKSESHDDTAADAIWPLTRPHDGCGEGREK